MLSPRSLSALLTLNISDYVQTLVLFTPSGAVLAYSNPSTIKKLRITAAIAASTYTSYNDIATDGTIAAAQRSPPTARNGGNAAISSISVELGTANMVISLIKPKLLLALIGPVEHPPAMNGAIGANDTVISNGASPGSSNASSSSSSTSVPVAQQQQQQQQHRVPRESPLRILQLKSEGMTEFLQEQLRGFRMPEEA